MGFIYSFPQPLSLTDTPTFAGIKLNGTGAVSININSISTNSIEDITSNTTILQSLLESHTATGATSPTIASIRSRGTVTSPTIVSLNDAIGFHNFYGYTGNSGVGYQLAAQVQYWICADGTTVSTTSMPGRIQFFTTPDLSISPAERMRINCTGTISLFGPLQMDGNRIYGDTGASGNLILSANSNTNLDFIQLSGSGANVIQIYNGQPNITATQTILSYAPTFSLGAGAVNVNSNTFSDTSTITIGAGAGTVAGINAINITQSITHNSSLACVYTGLNLGTTVTTTANAGFASSFTLFNGNPTLVSSTAGIYPFPVNGMFAATPTYNAGNVNVSSGSATFDIGLRHAATYNCTGASSAMTFSTQGSSSTVAMNANTAGSVLTCSIRRGFYFKNFTTTLTGAVVLTANIGLDVDDTTQTTGTGNGTVTNTLTCAVRSALTVGTGIFFLNDTGGAQSAFAGKFTKYNNITLVGVGVPSLTATIDTAALTANVGVATLLAITNAGLYRVSSLVVLTTAASVSSTLPNVQIVYTDQDTGGSVTIDATPILGVAGIGQTGALTANTVGTTSTGVIMINVKASTTIQYKTVNYASSLAGMAYTLRIRLEPV